MELFDILTLDYDKGGPSLNIGDVYVPITEIITPVRPAGIYEFGISMTWTYDRTNRSAYMRYSTNGGTSWNDFIAEPKDSTDANAMYYAYPRILAADGIQQLRVESRKETGAGTLDINFADCWIKRIN